MQLRTPLAGAAVVAALLAAPLLADEPADGFQLTSLPYPGQAVTATLSGGDILTFDGASVDRYDGNGAHLATLATFSPPVWASFLRPDPSETFAVLGESSNGELHRVDLAVGGSTVITTLVNNYDADFEDPQHLLVSAAPCVFGCGNAVYRVELATGATTLLASVDGASGPLAVGATGELYLGTVSAVWPPPPGASQVLRWSASQLTGNPVVDELDAVVVGSGYEALGSLVRDPVDGALYVAENDGNAGTNRVRRVTPFAASSPILVEGSPWNWITNLELFPGNGIASFRPYQPQTGGRLLYDTTDFFSLWARVELSPRRPGVLLSGPGTTGAGTVNLGLNGGAPGGVAWAYYGPSALFDPNELPILLAGQGIHLFLGLDPGTAALYPLAMPLDGFGQGGLSFPHDGSLLGLLAVQALVFDAGGTPVAITSADFL